jgi:cell division protein FtsL
MSPAHKALNRRARLTLEGVLAEALFVAALSCLCLLFCAAACALASI